MASTGFRDGGGRGPTWTRVLTNIKNLPTKELKREASFDQTRSNHYLNQIPRLITFSTGENCLETSLTPHPPKQTNKPSLTRKQNTGRNGEGARSDMRKNRLLGDLAGADQL